MAHRAQAYSVFMTCMDAKVTLTDNTGYGCHIKPQNLLTNHKRSITRHWLLIALGADTHTCKHTCIQTFTDSSNYKTPGVHQPQAGTCLV